MTPIDRRTILAIVAGLALASVVLLWFVYSERQAGPYPAGAHYPCKQWVAECALKRLLRDCRADAKQLGCR